MQTLRKLPTIDPSKKASAGKEPRKLGVDDGELGKACGIGKG